MVTCLFPPVIFPHLSLLQSWRRCALSARGWEIGVSHRGLRRANKGDDYLTAPLCIWCGAPLFVWGGSVLNAQGDVSQEADGRFKADTIAPPLPSLAFVSLNTRQQALTGTNSSTHTGSLPSFPTRKRFPISPPAVIGGVFLGEIGITCDDGVTSPPSHPRCTLCALFWHLSSWAPSWVCSPLSPEIKFFFFFFFFASINYQFTFLWLTSC